jgi:NADH-quinone oxidoreductase subunit L
MFRMWYLTFAGRPRNKQRYEHAHESPRVMTVPLVILAVFATIIAWEPFAGLGRLSDLSLVNLLEQSRPAGTLADTTGVLTTLVWPDEHFAHQSAQFWTVVWPVTWLATATAWSGIILATVMYAWGWVRPDEVRKQFSPIYRLLWHKWWFDELYDWMWVRPVLRIGGWIAACDRRLIDGLIDGTAWAVRWLAVAWDFIADRTLVDGLVNLMARWTYGIGVWLRGFQTGRLRQYVMFIVIGAVALYVLVSFFWTSSLAG